MTRTEFGFERPSCNCADCRKPCTYIPGFLLPSDLERMIPFGADPFIWAESNLRASPGALASKNGQTFRISTLVPASNPDHSCIHYSALGGCAIHSIAPFGCAFFTPHLPTTTPDEHRLADRGLFTVLLAIADPDSLYSQLWDHLYLKGLTTRPPEELRGQHEQVCR